MFQDDIVKLIHEKFKKLPKKGKPTTRSNGVQEWTVLASVFYVEENNIEILTIATGVKATPDEVLLKNVNKGYIVHDSHAEILALRLLNYYLAKQVQENADGILKKITGGKYQLKQGIDMGLYVSQLPCGDCSMGEVQGDRQSWDEECKPGTVVRGRSFFGQVGSIRTKPGRSDSLISYSKSCSDKLTIKQLTGILNNLNSLLIEPIYLKWLVVPQVSQKSKLDIERCFVTRFSPSDCSPYFLHRYSILFTTEEFEYRQKQASQSCPDAILSCNKLSSHQVINNGVKLGGKARVIKLANSSMVSRYNLLRLCLQKELKIDLACSYQDLKQQNAQRCAAVELAKGALGHWFDGTKDDFPAT